APYTLSLHDALPISTVLAAQHAVVVTNPEIAALTDAYALIKCLARQPARPAIHLVVNRAPQRGLGLATFERLADVSRRFAGCERSEEHTSELQSREK